MANLTDQLSSIRDNTTGWASRCINQLVLQSQDTPSSAFGFVNESGAYMPVFDLKNTWGLSYDSCIKYCGNDLVGYPNFDFGIFANSFTNWLLPWLALIAQLPFETESSFSNLISLFLAIGSPALITYSLSMSILNRYEARRHFKALRSKASESAVSNQWPDAVNLVKHIQYFLQEAQQVPIRFSQQQGWLSSLIVCPENHTWWKRVHAMLSRTRRAWTYSFWAQTTAAILAWIFTVSSAILAALGNESTALQLSASNLWIWMIPIVSGWILVGTQSLPHGVDNALATEGSRRALEEPLEGVYTEKAAQRGIYVGSGLAPQIYPSRAQTSARLDGPPLEDQQIPKWHGNSILGDEAERGPIYNYARAFTWFQLVMTMTRCLNTALDNVREGRACQPGPNETAQGIQARAGDSGVHLNLMPSATLPAGRVSRSTESRSASFDDASSIRHRGRQSQHGGVSRPKWNNTKPPKDNLQGDAMHTALYCNLEPHEPRSKPEKEVSLKAYTPWREVHAALWRNIVVASLVAMFVQWGTAGSSIVIAYYTPTTGFGCRSGSYLVYALLGTVVWLLLLASMLLSHAAALRYQEVQGRHTVQQRAQGADERHFTRSVLCGLAVLTRKVGKTLAVLNGMFLVASSFFEIIGIYDNCTCESVYFTRSSAGWVTIFKSNSDLVAFAKNVWIGGIFMSSAVALIVFTFFALGCSAFSSNEDE